ARCYPHSFTFYACHDIALAEAGRFSQSLHPSFFLHPFFSFCYFSRFNAVPGRTRAMALSLNKARLNNLADEIWKSAQRLRGKFKAYEYQNVILPIIVIRRLECVLLKWREDKKAEIRARKP